jgi:hypothetical protein
MQTVAFVTCAAWPGLTADDRLTCAALHQRGVPTAAVCWDDPAVDWNSFRVVVLRSAWDYVTRAAEFRAWIERMRRDQVALANSAATITWNLDKRYLAELAGRGVPVVPTVWLRRGESVDLAGVLATQGWDRAVVKPAISAGGENTWTTAARRAAADQAALDGLVRSGDVLVQRFMPQVGGEGEWSLIFFNKEYSHAVRKTAADGEFRIQAQYGGMTLVATPGDDLITAAQAVLAAVAEPLLYARVDGVVEEGQLVLMEVELIEPFLFLEAVPGSAERFAAAITQCG